MCKISSTKVGHLSSDAQKKKIGHKKIVPVEERQGTRLSHGAVSCDSYYIMGLPRGAFTFCFYKKISNFQKRNQTKNK